MICQGCRFGDCPQCTGDGATPCKLAIIGEAPGEMEVRSGMPFVGAAGRELDRLLATAGLQRKDIYVDNTVGCRPPAKKGNVKPPRSVIEACATRLAADMALADPDVVILLGSTPVSALADGLSLKANHGLAFTRTLWGRERKVIVMYHPAAVLHNPALLSVVESDWKRLPERIQQKHAVFVRHPRKVKTGVAVTGSMVSIDTETEYLGALTAPLVGISVMNGKEVLWTKDVAIARRPLILMHNAKYDLQVLRQHGLDLTSFKIADTMIAAYLLGEASLGLKPMTLRYLGYEMDSLEKMLEEADAILLTDHLQKGFDFPLTKQQFDSLVKCVEAADPGMALRRRPKLKEIIGEPPEADVTVLAKMFPERLKNYACDDADATYQHWPLLEARLKEAGLEHLFWDVEMPLVPVLADMERRGLAIDRKAAQGLYDEWTARTEGIADHLRKETGLESPGSPQQVSELVYGKLGIRPFAWTNSDQPSTAGWVLERIAEDVPVVTEILEWRKYTKLCCLDPATRVLTTDLRWVALQDIKVGQDLVGIEAERLPHQFRKMRKSRVLFKTTTKRPSYRLCLSNGKEIIASAEHPWLAR